MKFSEKLEIILEDILDATEQTIGLLGWFIVMSALVLLSPLWLPCFVLKRWRRRGL